MAISEDDLLGDITSGARDAIDLAARDMVGGDGGGIAREELVDALTCPISGKLFIDPVGRRCSRLDPTRLKATWFQTLFAKRI